MSAVSRRVGVFRTLVPDAANASFLCFVGNVSNVGRSIAGYLSNWPWGLRRVGQLLGKVSTESDGTETQDLSYGLGS